jgi:hypothetical protein
MANQRSNSISPWTFDPSSEPSIVSFFVTELSFGLPFDLYAFSMARPQPAPAPQRSSEDAPAA